MGDNTQQEKLAPRDTAARKPSLMLPGLMLWLPIPVFLVLDIIIGFSALSDSYPPVSLSDNSTITLYSHDTISLDVLGEVACIVTGPKGYSTTVQRKPGAPEDQNLTFVTGARGDYRIDCGDGSYVTIDDAEKDLGVEAASHQANEEIAIVACTGALTMAAGLVILIQRMRQRRKMSQTGAQAQATD